MELTTGTPEDAPRLVDLIKRPPEIFELVPLADDYIGNCMVRLQPEASVAIECLFGKPRVAPPDDLSLPAKIEEPQNMLHLMQAIRIELMHALHRRGDRVWLHELGADPQVLKHKNALLAGRKLLELIRVFPANFTVEDRGNGNVVVKLTNIDVTDTSMIPDVLEKFMAQEANKDALGDKGKGKGKGRGKAKAKAKDALEVAPGVRFLYKGFRETTGYAIREAGAKACLEVCVPMFWQQPRISARGLTQSCVRCWSTSWMATSAVFAPTACCPRTSRKIATTTRRYSWCPVATTSVPSA